MLNRHILLAKHLKQSASEKLKELKEDEEVDDKILARQSELIDEFDEILEQLETSIDALESENQQKPFRIFGIPADTSLVMTVLSGILSYYGALISLYAADNPLFGDVGQAL